MPNQLDRFAGDGVMRSHLRHHDWANCPLGHPASWPVTLRMAVAMMLDSGLPMWVCWGADLLLLYNDGYATILGAKHPEALSRPYAEIWPEIWEYLEPVVSRAIAGESTFFEDTELILHRQGKPERTWFTYSISPLRDENGGVVGIYGTAIETTRHVLANHKRAAEIEDLRQMFLLAPSFMAVLRGPEHCFDIVNEAFMQLICHRPVLGKTVVQALPETVEQGFVALLDEVYSTGKAYNGSGVKYVVQPVSDGARSDLFLNFVYQPIIGPTGEVSGIFVEGVDVTEQRRTTQALESLNADLERQVTERSQDRNALWTLSSDIMLRCNFDGVITATNPAWHDLLGWAEHELIGLNLFDLIHPEDIAHTIEGAQQLADGISHQRFDNRYRHRDGSYRWISWSTRPHDNLINAVGRDITRDKEQTAELEAMQNALRQSQKMEAVGQLTGGLAHDFNNLLAGISGALQLMQIRLQQGRFNEFDRYIAVAQGASKRAAALTHRLLAFSRQQTLTPKPTNVNPLVANMHELVQRTVGPATLIEVVGAADAWTALVDSSQLENALLNLCINARDAMPDGGRITIETANKWIDERTALKQSMAQGQYVSLCVSDTGTGMTPEVISRAFDPFFTTKPIGQGTGLGLSMIYGFAQQSGGQVRIYSEVGQGTTVCIYLPRHYGDSIDDTATVQITAVQRAEQLATVLIVDDEPTVRMLLIEILDDLGYAWIEAEDSATGLKILQSDARIDLLISDVGLPGGMNGRQMADAGCVARPGLPVLFITGYAENAVLNNGYLEPGMAVLTKPFSIEAIAERIRSMVVEGRPSSKDKN